MCVSPFFVLGYCTLFLAYVSLPNLLRAFLFPYDGSKAVHSYRKCTTSVSWLMNLTTLQHGLSNNIAEVEYLLLGRIYRLPAGAVQCHGQWICSRSSTALHSFPENFLDSREDFLSSPLCCHACILHIFLSCGLIFIFFFFLSPLTFFYAYSLLFISPLLNSCPMMDLDLWSWDFLAPTFRH